MAYRSNDFTDDHTFRLAVESMLESLLEQTDLIDSDEHEARLTPGNLTVTFESGGTYILSQQTPVYELWLSADRRAWHFVRVDGRWIERDDEDPLQDVLGKLFSAKMGMDISFEL